VDIWAGAGKVERGKKHNRPGATCEGNRNALVGWRMATLNGATQAAVDGGGGEARGKNKGGSGRTMRGGGVTMRSRSRGEGASGLGADGEGRSASKGRAAESEREGRWAETADGAWLKEEGWWWWWGQ